MLYLLMSEHTQSIPMQRLRLPLISPILITIVLFSSYASTAAIAIANGPIGHDANTVITDSSSNSTSPRGRVSSTGIELEESWVPEPKTRGSMGLLVSCTLTIGLSVWSTMLINVQMAASATMGSVLHGDDKTKDSDNKNSTLAKFWAWLTSEASFHHFVGWKYKTLWAVLALLVPELPLAIALGELLFARNLLAELKKKDEEVFGKWDVKVAYYAVMGGFYLVDPADVAEEGKRHHTLNERMNYVIERRVRDAHKRAKFPRSEKHNDEKMRDVLTPHGLHYIARLIHALRVRGNPEDIANMKELSGYLSDISSAALDDFGKADVVARLIVCVQAFWMLIQVCGRLREGIPVTLLELHTALHAACALVMYIVWWYKPKDATITTPIFLSKEQYEHMGKCKTEDITNILRIERRVRDFLRSKKSPQPPELTPATDEDLIAPGPPNEPVSSATPTISNSGSTAEGSSGPTIALAEHQDGKEATNSKEASIFTKFANYWASLLDLDEQEEYNAFYRTSQSTLSKENYKQITGRQPFGKDSFKAILQVLVHLVFNWSRWPGKAIIWFTTSFLYSGFHLSSWYWHLPTRQEEILWHICTVYTVGAVTSIFFLAALMAVYIPLFNLVTRKNENASPKIESLKAWKLVFAFIEGLVYGLREVVRHGLRFVALTIAIGIWPWILARLCMLIEAYISLRSLEKGAFKTIDWAEAIPHL